MKFGFEEVEDLHVTYFNRIMTQGFSGRITQFKLCSLPILNGTWEKRTPETAVSESLSAGRDAE